MKQLFLGISLLLAVDCLTAQEADQKIGDLINKNDWFTLEEIFVKEKNNIQSLTLSLLAETLLSLSFNQQERASQLLDSLLMYYQHDLSFENISNLVLMKGKIIGDSGYYSQSADYINHFLKTVPIFSNHIALAEMYGELRNEQKPEIVRPDKDTEIPLTIKEAGKGRLMFVPVTINGKTRSFIFDTGASSTFISERFAREAGVRIVRDSIPITGVEVCTGKTGTIDSLMVGDIIFKNPMIFVSDNTPDIDSIYQIDAILGLDFIKRVGEVQIFPDQGKILFPKSRTPLPKTGRNLLIENNQPYLKAFSGDERLMFHFDTGDADGELYQPYFLKHQEEVEGKGTKEEVRRGGFCGYRNISGYRIPSISLKIGNTAFDWPDIFVATESAHSVQQDEDGALGMIFISKFKKITINFEDMFVEAE
ncbi:MAG: retroviral-like aspartic protease family protein [Bacteroidales bacterium]|nr:retroviral-like aspartic protease family protein [Bacteroidales bacterium]